MKFVKALVAASFSLAFCFGLGSFMLMRAMDILGAGQLTYSRRGQAPVTVSPEAHPFSYFYQVAFHGALAGFCLLLGIAVCMYGLAKVLCSFGSAQSPAAARIYRSATSVAWVGIGLGVVWLLLLILRGGLIL